MSFQDGALWNDCGLWQWWTGRGLYISLDDFGIEAPEPTLPPLLPEIVPPVVPKKSFHDAPSGMVSVTSTMGEPLPNGSSNGIVVLQQPYQPQMSMQAITGTMAFVTATLGMTYGQAYTTTMPPVTNTCTTSSPTLPSGNSASVTTNGTTYVIQNNGSGQVCIITNGAGK